MDDDVAIGANPFDEFASPSGTAVVGSQNPPTEQADTGAKSKPSVDKGGWKQGDANPFDEYSDDSFQAAPPPTMLQSMAAHIEHDNVTAHLGQAVREKQAQNIVERYQKYGAAKPGANPLDLTGPVPQSIYDKAVGDLAAWKMERDQWESLHSNTAESVTGAVLGGLVGGALDPVNWAIGGLGWGANAGKAAYAIGQATGVTGVAYNAGMRMLTPWMTERAAGATLGIAGNIATHAAEGAAIMAPIDIAQQEADIWTHHQANIDWGNTVFSALFGAALSGGMASLRTLLMGVRGELPHQVDAQFDFLTPQNAGAPLESAAHTGEAPNLSYPKYEGPIPKNFENAGIKPADISADLAAHAATVFPKAEAGQALEAAALQRAYSEPGTRDDVRANFGGEPPAEEGAAETPKPYKVLEPPTESAPSLITFLRNQGGIKDDGDLQRIFGRGNRTQYGKGRLVTKDGMSLDDALTAAQEAGYFPKTEGEAKLTVADLLDAIREDAAGRKVYPQGMSKEEIASRRAYDMQTAELDAAEKFIRKNVKISDEAEPFSDQVWRDAAMHMVLGGEQDPVRAFDRAVLDHERGLNFELPEGVQPHEVHGATAHGNGEAVEGTRRGRAGYDETGRLVNAGEGFRGPSEAGGAPREGAGGEAGAALPDVKAMDADAVASELKALGVKPPKFKMEQKAKLAESAYKQAADCLAKAGFLGAGIMGATITAAKGTKVQFERDENGAITGATFGNGKVAFSRDPETGAINGAELTS